MLVENSISRYRARAETLQCYYYSGKSLTMYLFTIVIILLLDKVLFSHGLDAEKCCKSGEYLNKINSTYQCTEFTSKRLSILLNETNFLEKYTEGECFDISSDFSVFTVESGQIVEERPIKERYFSKCCPLNYYYNSITHSCVENVNMAHEFIRDVFVKVGLPDCKFVEDKELSNLTNIYEDIIEVRNDVNYCIDVNEKNVFIMRECKGPEVCDHVKCIKKCCPDGKSFVNGAKCMDTYTNGLNLTFSSVIEKPTDPFAIIHNRTCPRIYLMSQSRYIFSLDEHGIFKYWKNFTNSFIYEDVNYEYSYCIEHSKSKKAEGFFFFKCFEKEQYKEKFEYTFWPKILSCIFLALTILIYLFLNETRTLFGKILMNYCVATLVLFSLLSYAHIDLRPSDLQCKLIGYALIFFSTVSFAWLNIMCCDIWATFGSTKQSVGIHQRKKDLKRLLWYLLYGWGMPVLLTLIIFLFSLTAVLPTSIHPFVGSTVCFIENRNGNYAPILFLRLPHLIIQLVNTILFFKTIIYCLRIKNEINKINDTTKQEKSHRFKKDKERLSLIVKLSIIMGVTYIFDVMSAFFDMSEMGTVTKYIEIVWDCINCLQGVFIFIIFICKRKIYNDFLRKTKMSKRREPLKSSQSITSSTRISNNTRMSVLNSVPNKAAAETKFEKN